MSAVVILWKNKKYGYEHIALLLNNTKDKKDKEAFSTYISIYRPLRENRSKQRYTYQTLESDLLHNIKLKHVVIPSNEDGNKFGVAEGIIVRHWQELSKLKDIHHKKFTEFLEGNFTINDIDASIFLEPNKEKNPFFYFSEEKKFLTPTQRAGKQKALEDLSLEFEKFRGPIEPPANNNGLFAKVEEPKLLDCNKFIIKLLEKGGLNLALDPQLLEEKLREKPISLDGFIEPAEIIRIAEVAAKMFSALNSEPTQTVDAFTSQSPHTKPTV